MRAQMTENGRIYLLSLAGGTGFQALLSEIASFADGQGLSREGYEAALIQRELRFPTAIQAGTGVAIPHADPTYAKKTSMIVAVLDRPVAFSAMGGGEGQVLVEVVFLLLMTEAKKHLELLSAVANFIQKEEKLQELKGDGAMEAITREFGSLFLQDH